MPVSKEEGDAARTLTPGQVFGEQLEGIRRRKGWTQRQLADEMKRLNVPVGQSAIANIENSSRRVTVDEMMTFAVALGVSPAALLVPRESSARVMVGDM